MSRRASVGVPVGVAAAVLAAVLLGVLLRNGGGRPAPLPLSLAGSGAQAETASDSKRGVGMSAPGGGPSYRFVGPVPDGLPDKADVYRLSDGAPARADVRRLADAFGLSGAVTAEPDALVVRDGEWMLRVSTSASRMWSFYREVKPTCVQPLPADLSPEERDKLAAQECVEGGSGGGSTGSGSTGSGGGMAGICQAGVESPCNDTPETKGDEPSSGTASDLVMSCPEPAPCPPDTKCAPAPCGPYEEPKPLPLGPESDARRTAQKVFDAAGIGNGATIRAERGFDAWFISATVRVGGFEVIGLGHSVSIDGDGKIRDASGSLASAEVLDRYPIVTPKAGLDRLQKQYSFYGEPRTLIACAPETPECNGPTTPEVLDVTGVRLGLLFSPIWDNEKETVFLAPAWIFEIKGRDYPEAVIAVADEYLQGITPEQPKGEPEPILVDPGQPAPPTQVDPAQPEPTQPQPEPAPAPPTSDPGARPSPSEVPAPRSAEPNPSASDQPAQHGTVSAEPQPEPAST